MICLYLWVCVQIVLESFPVSSSGHTKLLSYLCPVSVLSPALLKAFDYFLHIPTVIIVAVFFRRGWLFPFRHMRRCLSLIIKISALTAFATSVTLAVYGLTLLLPEIEMPLWFGFFITACSLLSLLVCPDKPYTRLDIKKTLCLGVLQACALVPGISRFAVTFVGARWLGISARRAFEISFLIQWPLILCASIYGFYLLQVDVHELLNLKLLCVMLGSSSMAYAGLCMQRDMIQKQTMWRWGVYAFVPLLISIFLGVLYA